MKKMMSAVLLCAVSVSYAGFDEGVIVKADKNSTNSIGVCQLIPQQKIDIKDKSAEYLLLSTAYADEYVFKLKKDNKIRNWENAKVTLLEPPKYGTLDKSYYYHAKSQITTGKDKAVFLVELDNYKIEVVFFIKFVQGIGNRGYQINCPEPNYWQISPKR